LQAFIYLVFFGKKFIQGHTNSHPIKSHFGPPKTLLRTPRGPGTPGWESAVLGLPGKVNAKCIEKRSREIIETKLVNVQCGFRPGRSITDHSSHSGKYSRNPGSMPKTSTHVLSTSRKHKTGSFWKSFVECFGSTILMAAYKKSLYSCSEICVCVGRLKSQPFTVGVGLRQGCVLSVSPHIFIV